MNDDAQLRELRAEVECLGPCSPARRFPAALKARIVTWVVTRRRAGMTTTEVARALGVPWESLSRWVAEAAQGAPTPAASSKPKPVRLRPVRVVAPPPPVPSPALVLRTPRGFTVEGLDLATLVHLLERLG